MVDLSTTISSFETEVNKALRILARKLREQAKARTGTTKGEATEKDHKFQCEKKLKEVFDYYKTKVPLDVLSHKLLEFGKKIDHAQLYSLSTQECYDTILDSQASAGSEQHQQLPFHITATAFYRKAFCDCDWNDDDAVLSYLDSHAREAAAMVDEAEKEALVAKLKGIFAGRADAGALVAAAMA